MVGFVLAQKADPLLLLLLPLLTPSLALLFLDHATNIGNIGEYIDKVLKPLLQEEAREPRLLCYEEWVDAFSDSRFGGCCLSAFLLSCCSASSPWRPCCTR